MTAIIISQGKQMTKLSEVSRWEDEISLIGRGDRVEGGQGGAANAQAQQLANRSRYLLDSLEAIATGVQPYSSLAKAQADLTGGKIELNAKVSVRSATDGVWIDEYQNVTGVLTRTGKSLITQQAVTALLAAIYNDTGRQPLRVNLFDAGRAADGVYVNETGATSANVAYYASGKIPVMAAEKYVFARNVAHLAWYDVNGTMLAYATGVTAGAAVTAPANAWSIQFSQTLSTGKGAQMLVKGDTLPDEYRAFGFVDPVSARRSATAKAIDVCYRSNALVRNLFDKNRASDGYALSTSGSLTANASYFVTDYIPVLPGETYILSAGTQVLCYYDQDLVKTTNISVSASTPFTAPVGAYYLRFQSTPLAAKESLMVIRGSVLPVSYVGFGAMTVSDATVLSQSLAWAVTDGNLPVARNLFNKGTAIDGYALAASGVPYAATGYFVTPFIPVKPGQQYTLSGTSNVVVFFDANKAKISNLVATAGAAFSSPAGAVYMRFQISGLAVKNALMLAEGAALPASYVSFGAAPESYVDQQSMISARAVALSLQKTAVNIYNSELALSNTAVSYQNGTTSTVADYFATPLLMVTPGGSFVSNYASGGGAFYRIDGAFLSGFTDLKASTAYSVPANAFFVRFHVYGLTKIDSLMVSPGQAVPAGYIPFGGRAAELPRQGQKRIDLGDSITNTGNFIAPLNSRTGMVALANYGVPGQGVRTMANSLTAETIADADFISVLGGTNDYGGNRRLGTIDDARADYDEAAAKSFYYDVFYVLNRIYTLKPSVRVMFSTPLKRGAFESQPVYPAANAAGFRLPQYVQAIKEVCALFSVPVCDLYAESGFNLHNLSVFTLDNLHPNAAGGALMARRMATVINAI